MPDVDELGMAYHFKFLTDEAARPVDGAPDRWFPLACALPCYLSCLRPRFGAMKASDWPSGDQRGCLTARRRRVRCSSAPVATSTNAICDSRRFASRSARATISATARPARRLLRIGQAH
jgi:hypothetical protein